MEFRNRFHRGQVVHHRLFHYRGVIVAVDQTFRMTDEWYHTVARSRPPKDRPWYRVLVNGSNDTTYVAERNLELDTTGEPVRHPLVDQHFDRFENGFYSHSREVN